MHGQSIQLGLKVLKCVHHRPCLRLVSRAPAAAVDSRVNSSISSCWHAAEQARLQYVHVHQMQSSVAILARVSVQSTVLQYCASLLLLQLIY
jgi:hypothetical protein